MAGHPRPRVQRPCPGGRRHPAGGAGDAGGPGRGHPRAAPAGRCCAGRGRRGAAGAAGGEGPGPVEVSRRGRPRQLAWTPNTMLGHGAGRRPPSNLTPNRRLATSQPAPGGTPAPAPVEAEGQSEGVKYEGYAEAIAIAQGQVSWARTWLDQWWGERSGPGMCTMACGGSGAPHPLLHWCARDI